MKKKAVLFCLLALVLSALAVWLFYLVNVSFKLSTRNSDWGDFGSYFGGVLGPILSFGSIVFVWVQSQENLKRIENQIKEQEFTRFCELISLGFNRLDSVSQTCVFIYQKNLFLNSNDLVEPIEIGKLIKNMNPLSEPCSTDTKFSLKQNFGIYIDAINIIISLFSSFEVTEEKHIIIYNSYLDSFKARIASVYKTDRLMEAFCLELPKKK